MTSYSDEHRGKKRRLSNLESGPSHSKKTQRLSFNASELSKYDFDEYKPMLALYLDLQKQLDIESLSREEAKGRWKSFVKKWNRGELAEGWYDPETKRKTVSSTTTLDSSPSQKRSKRNSPEHGINAVKDTHSDEDDEYGPALPENGGRALVRPAVPSMQDLEMRNEMAAEDALYQREDLRYERQMDRKQQKERLEEIAPRAEPGTRERQLEKKREKADQTRSFRDKSPGAAEVGETDMYGEDGIEGYKARKQEMEKKKNERELRKEEIWRARAKEREERLEEHRAKEEKTMDMFRALAKERFG